MDKHVSNVCSAGFYRLRQLRRVRRSLDSAMRHYLTVPRHSLSSYGRRAFAVAGPTAWNSLSDDLCDPTLSTDSFRGLLKTRLFSGCLSEKNTRLHFLK